MFIENGSDVFVINVEGRICLYMMICFGVYGLVVKFVYYGV